MIDQSIPYVPLILYKTDPHNYPRYDLPAGYRFEFYQKGDEVAWAELECSLGQFQTVEEGVQCFAREFLTDSALIPEERVFFVRNEANETVATAALWEGEFLGEIRPRAHWLAVSDACAGRGIAKAVFCHILDLYRQYRLTGMIYLLTATRYYPAIAIYKKFGFSFYDGERSLSKRLSDEEFQKRNKEAISLVESKINEYKIPAAVTVRPSATEDLDAIMPILNEARGTIAKLGIDQWQDGYPSRDVIEDDIEKKRSYVAERSGAICGTFVLVDDGEPTYDKIFEGHWLTGDDSADYVAIHRVAISVASRGSGVSTTVIDAAADYARALGRASLRIDTHEGNVVMRRMLEKHGFTYCGIIYLQSGASRVAYEKIVK